jgi:hypothetical protein
MNATVPATTWTPKAGDLVCCSYRLPIPWQFWIHPVHVGVVREPGDDPASWNGRNSERAYCEATGRLPVEYLRPGKAGGFLQHDSLDSLFPVPEGRGAPWMLRDEDEGWDIVYRGHAYATRHHRERVESIGLALEWQDGVASALYRFGSSRMVQDEGHRVALLAEVEGCTGQYLAEAARRPPLPAGRDTQLAALRQLLGIARHAPAGVELAALHPLARAGR